MAPTVPFALLGVVQLTAVAAWLGLAATATLTRRRGVAAVGLAAGALCLAAADAIPAVQYDVSASQPVGWLRVAGLALLAVAALGGPPGVRRTTTSGSVSGFVAPLGIAFAPAVLAGAIGVVATGITLARSRESSQRAVGRWLAVALLATTAAAVLAYPARDSSAAADAELAVRGLATALLLVAVLLVARTALVGKLVGAIVAGVVVMAVGAVAIAGVGVAGEVQSEQSARLLSVAHTQAAALRSLETRAALDAQVVAACPTDRSQCIRALDIFASTPSFFAVLDQPGHGLQVVAPHHSPLTSAQLLSLAGSPVVRAALRPHATANGVTGGPVLLPGKPDLLAIVAAVPGRPNGVTSVTVKPTFAAIYGIGLVDPYLATLRSEIGYDVSVVADGRLIASSLHGRQRAALLAETRAARVDSIAANRSVVQPAAGTSPTAAMVPVTAAGNGDVRLATLVVSQPASKALAAQESVLRRLVLTALVVLLVVALFAVGLARRIAHPVRRLTAAARQVRGGDLTTPVTIASHDEVGTLARAFSDMTTSLRSLTDDLRDAAAAEAALRARLETVIAAMTDGVISTDADGVVTSANEEALRLLGGGQADVVGRPVTEILDVRRSDGVALLPADRIDAEGNLMTAGRSATPVRLAVAPLAADGGSVITLVDRSREREVERMKTEFLANVSHELRTPLTPIRGYAEMLAHRRALTGRQVEQFAGEILVSTDRMNRVVALLVDVAALDAGRVRPAEDDIAPADLVDQAIAGWRERWPDRADDFRRSVARGLPPVHVDAEWVHKALTELADNAVKVTDAGSRITLRAEATDAGSAAPAVRVKVGDLGPGIETDRLEELFGDFSQADASDTRTLEGLGLGLGFVRRVSEQFGLRLHVESSPGKGSEIGLDLPVASGTAPRAKPALRRRPGDRLRSRAVAAGGRAAAAAGSRSRRRRAGEGDR